MLQHLQARDLAGLATSCRALRALVTTAPASVWQRAAEKVSPWHPCIPNTVQAVQAALNGRAESAPNITGGRQPQQRACEPDIPGVLQQCKMSPDGQTLARAWLSRSYDAAGVVLIPCRSQQRILIAFDVSEHEYCSYHSMSWQADAKHLLVIFSTSEAMRFVLFDPLSGARRASYTLLVKQSAGSHLFWHERLPLVLVTETSDFPSKAKFVDIEAQAVTALDIPDRWASKGSCMLSTTSWSVARKVAIVCYDWQRSAFQHI